MSSIPCAFREFHFAEGTVEDVEDIEVDNDENDFAADLRKNLAISDLKFLTKEMGIFSMSKSWVKGYFKKFGGIDDF